MMTSLGIVGRVFCVLCVVMTALVARVNAQDPEWVVALGPDMQLARMGHAGVLLDDGTPVVFGGHGAGFTALDSAEIWDWTAGAFIALDMHYTHDSAALARLADGRYLLAGGAADFGVAPGHVGAEIYDPANNSFATTGSLNFPRMNASAATLADGSVLIVGGWYDTPSPLYGERFEPQTGEFTLTENLGLPRALPVLLPTSDGGAVVLGGMSPYGDSVREQVEYYDPVGNRFSTLQATLFSNESGWQITASNFAPPQQMADGRYLLVASRAGPAGLDYTLFTFDPQTRDISRQVTSPALPGSELANLFPPIIDTSTDTALLLGHRIDGDEVLVNLVLADLGDWSTRSPSYTFRLPTAYYLDGASAVRLLDGRLFVAGGHSQRGGESNFSALGSSLFVELELPDSCTFTLSSWRESVSAGTGQGSITLTASDESCAWSATSGAAWVAVSSGASGTGSATVSFTIAINPGEVPRMAVLDIAGKNLIIMQEGTVKLATQTGSNGDDILIVEPGTSGVDGLGGVDTLALPSFPGAYTFTQIGTAQYRAEYFDQTLTISNIEHLRFGTATQTTLPIAALLSDQLQDQTSKLTDLYLAFFGRAPDVSGLEYWFYRLFQDQRSFADISKDFAWSPEAQALYPPAGSNRDFVRNVYQNVFDRDPDPGGWDYWTARLDALGETDLNDRGAFVGELLLGAYAPTSGASDRDLLINRHNVALSYVNRLSLQPEKGFDTAINNLLGQVNLDEDSVTGAQQVLDYVFDSNRSLTEIVEDPVMMDTVSAVDAYIEWEEDAAWLPATVTLPTNSPLMPSEAAISVLFDDYIPDHEGKVEIPIPDTPFTDAFVLLQLPGSEEFVVYLFATILDQQQSVEFSAHATAVNLVMNGIDREYLLGELTPEQIHQTIGENSVAFISEFTAALESDPFYLRIENLDTVYGDKFTAAVNASEAALRAELGSGTAMYSLQQQSASDTESEGLMVLPSKELYDFKVFPARGGLLGYGSMTGELLIQNDTMLPARYLTNERLSGKTLHHTTLGLFGDLIAPQWSLLYGYNAGSATTKDTKYQASELIVFTPGWADFETDNLWLASYNSNMNLALNQRLLLDNIIVILSSLIPVSDESFYIPWFQWVGDQGWFQTAADKLYSDHDLPAAIQSFATGMANADNLKATLNFASRYFAKSAVAKKTIAKQLLKSQAEWLFKTYTWKAKVVIYAADLASTTADLIKTPPVIEFDKVAFPLHLDNWGPSGMSKVSTPDENRRVTLFGGGLEAFVAGGSYEPEVALQARDTDGTNHLQIIPGKDIHVDSSDSVSFDLPFEWVGAGSDIVGPVYFQLQHAFVDPNTGSVINNIKAPLSLGDEAYKIVLGSEVVITAVSEDKVTRGAELFVYGNGFASSFNDNTVRFTDHLGVSAAAAIDYATADRIELTVPATLAIGPLTIEVELKDGTKSNRHGITLIPQSVTADPPDLTHFDGELWVSLMQSDGLPIFYSIGSGDDEAYFLPIVAESSITVYAYAKEIVDAVEYRSYTSRFVYYHCAEGEVLVNGVCEAPVIPTTEKVIDFSILPGHNDESPHISGSHFQLPLTITESGLISFDLRDVYDGGGDVRSWHLWGTGSFDGNRLILNGSWTMDRTGGWDSQYGDVITQSDIGTFRVDTRGYWDEPPTESQASTRLVTEYGTWDNNQQSPDVSVHNLSQLTE